MVAVDVGQRLYRHAEMAGRLPEVDPVLHHPRRARMPERVRRYRAVEPCELYRQYLPAEKRRWATLFHLGFLRPAAMHYRRLKSDPADDRVRHPPAGRRSRRTVCRWQGR